MSNPTQFEKIGLQSFKRYLCRLMPVRWRFTRIFNTCGWGCPESVSGGGSTIENTEPIRTRLPQLFTQLNIRSLLDAPCGDFNWMQKMLQEAPGNVDYTGADIVKPLIKSLKKHGSDTMRFIVADIIQDQLPVVDLILCRDCFIHFSEKDIWKTLANFRRTRARYLVTNSFSGIHMNEDIETGKWRQLNLEIAPFNFPPPIERISEAGTNGKFLGVWRIDMIGAA